MTKVSSQLKLRPFRRGDEPSIVRYANNKKIERGLAQFPIPYRLFNARTWVRKCLNEAKRRPLEKVHFAIEFGGECVGSISLTLKGHGIGELGYWLGEPFWGRGIMTKAVKHVVRHGNVKHGLHRIEAYTFPFNVGSQRVLEKAGFKREGYLREFRKKHKRYIDSILFAKIITTHR